MVFSSVTFLFIFLPVTAALYFLPSVFLRPESTGRIKSKRFRKSILTHKNAVLCAASLFFYAWGEPVNIVLMLISIFFNYCIGLDLKKHEGNKTHRKLLLASALVVDISMLALFKYGGFVVDNVNAVFGLDIGFSSLALPVGISFYTFQIISYIVDVYTGRVSAQENLLSFALYISMFPQLIAGPIVQYSAIEAQLSVRKEELPQAAQGIRLFIAGLSKKVILANTAGAVFSSITGDGIGNLSSLGAWTAILFYTFQIYYDFSGYSDMAIGLGRLFGFEFPENFNYPYIADSITDFWRRWHISLSSWFRDYVYIPLGGSRRSLVRNVFNIFTVWLLTGLWHGAAWNFVLWGIYYFLLLALEKYVFADIRKRIPKNIRRVLTFILVMFGWVLFSSATLSDAAGFFGAMFGRNGAWDSMAVYELSSNAVMLAAMAVFATPLFAFKRRNKRKLPRAVLLLICIVLFMLCIVCLIGDTYNPFLYFRF